MSRCPPNVFVGDYATTFQSLVLAGDVNLILPPDSTRVTIVLAVSVEQSGNVCVGTVPDPQGIQGFTVESGGAPIVLTYRDWGPLLGGAWYAVLLTSTVNLNVWTVSYRPGGG